MRDLLAPSPLPWGKMCVLSGIMAVQGFALTHVWPSLIWFFQELLCPYHPFQSSCSDELNWDIGGSEDPNALTSLNATLSGDFGSPSSFSPAVLSRPDNEHGLPWSNQEVVIGRDPVIASGAVSALFFLGQAIGAGLLLRLSEAWGRKTLLLLCLALTSVLMVASPFSGGFWSMAILRFCLGLACGYGPVVLVYFHEILRGDTEDIRARGWAVLATGWTMGAILGPLAGAYLIYPVQQHSSMWENDSDLQKLFIALPFLGPGLFGAGLGCVTFAALKALLRESLPAHERRPLWEEDDASEYSMHLPWSAYGREPEGGARHHSMMASHWARIPGTWAVSSSVLLSKEATQVLGPSSSLFLYDNPKFAARLEPTVARPLQPPSLEDALTSEDAPQPETASIQFSSSFTPKPKARRSISQERLMSEEWSSGGYVSAPPQLFSTAGKEAARTALDSGAGRTLPPQVLSRMLKAAAHGVAPPSPTISMRKSVGRRSNSRSTSRDLRSNRSSQSSSRGGRGLVVVSPPPEEQALLQRQVDMKESDSGASSGCKMAAAMMLYGFVQAAQSGLEETVGLWTARDQQWTPARTGLTQSGGLLVALCFMRMWIPHKVSERKLRWIFVITGLCWMAVVGALGPAQHAEWFESAPTLLASMLVLRALCGAFMVGASSALVPGGPWPGSEATLVGIMQAVGVVGISMILTYVHPSPSIAYGSLACVGAGLVMAVGSSG